MAVEGLPSDRNRLALFVYVGFRFYIPSGSVREAEVSYGYNNSLYGCIGAGVYSRVFGIVCRVLRHVCAARIPFSVGTKKRSSDLTSEDRNSSCDKTFDL